MAAPDHSRGLLSRCIRWIRTHADEKPTSPRFTNTQVLEFLQSAMDEIIDEVYGMADGPPLSRFNITLNSGQDLYALPCDVKEVHRVGQYETTTGLVEWEMIPGSKFNPLGPGWNIEGSFLRFTPTPQSDMNGEVVTVEYVPGGHMLFHQGFANQFATEGDAGDQYWDAASTYSTGNTDYTDLATFKLEHRTATEAAYAWTMGEFDYRPNAFIGHILRVLGTHDDAAADKVTSGYQIFPLQERLIVGYDQVDQIVWVEPTFDVDADDIVDADLEVVASLGDVGSGFTRIIYEVIPQLDRSLWWLASVKAATEIAVTCKRYKTATGLAEIYRTKLRAAQLRWANVQLRTTDCFDSEEEDWDEDYML